MDNPLLNIDGLPAFHSIKPEHIEPAIDHVLTKNRQSIARLLKDNAGNYTWDNTFQVLEELDDRLNRVWSPASHLHSVLDNDELRKAYNNCLPKLSEYGTELGQNKDLYNAYLSLSQSDEFSQLTVAQQRIVELTLRDFKLSGIALEESAQKKYKEIQKKLSELQTRFEENLLDATHAWEKHIKDDSQLAGLPESAIMLAAQTAREKNMEGWIFTLEFPSYIPVMKYADDAEFRREMYVAYVTRASDQGPQAKQWDNTDIMYEILSLRYQLSVLLGFKNFAEYSLEKKMAKSTEDTMEFLLDLANRSRPVAKKEMDELVEFAKKEYGEENICAWDLAYYSEKLRQKKFNLSQEELKPYFPVDQVLDGLFAIVNKLYGINIKSGKNVETWHKDVRFFEIYDDSDNLRGCFYLDLFSRPRKRGGAWMDECIVRKKTNTGIQNPVAYLICNFTPPIGDSPSLLTHDEVMTLFHEFGHGLHHLLTNVDFPSVAGINGVPWDAVELPSQFMENWCWEREAIDLVGKHFKTGEKIKSELFDRLLASKTFQSGMQMVRQLEFAIFDFRLHLEYDDKNRVDIQELVNDVRKQVAVVFPPDFNRFQHSFSHIFAGGYAAGYYSYKWAEVLSADAFSKFEENGIFDKVTGLGFLHSILEQGGTRDPMELFVEFRGREPNIEALLRHSGIAA